MTGRAKWRALTIAVASAGLLGSLAVGSTATPAKGEATRGAVTFRVYCGSCHGRTAKGDGKLASSLRQAPADLTLLARQNGGVFDADKVRAAIDGREEVAAHGDREMPVWGLSFQRPEEGGDQEAEVAAKLSDLVAYLETLQAPAEKSAD